MVIDCPRIPDLRYPVRCSLPLQRHCTDMIQKVSYSNLCNDSDGQNFCDCQLRHTNIERCMYYGRHVEPLAFSIDAATVNPQYFCPLFAVLPTEIRDTIYEYAFTDCTSAPFRYR